jgi:hypothetical protein
MMQAGGGPSGEWSTLIVGHQWPSDMTIAGLNTWIQNRGQIADAHHNIADLLNAAKTGPLAMQEGKTADHLVQLFDDGEQLARDIAQKNGVKKDAYSTALSSVHNLREILSDIADRYNQEIKQILQSKEPVAVKMPHILEAIGRGQQEANVAAASCGGDIGDAGQRILDQEAAGQSFRQFTSANGVDMGQLFRSRGTGALEPTVKDMLSSQDLSGAAGGDAATGVNPPVSGLSGAATGGLSGEAAGGGAVPGVNPAVSGLSGRGPGGGSVPTAVNPSVGAAGGAGVPTGVNPAAPGVSGGAASGGRLPAGANPSSAGSLARAVGYQTTTPGLTPPLSPPGAPAPPVPPGASPTDVPGAGPVAHGNGANPLAAPAPDPKPVVQNAGYNPAPPPISPHAEPVVQGSGPNSMTGVSPTTVAPLPAAPQAAPGPMFSQGFSSFGGGPSGSPGMPFNGGGFQGGPSPSFGAGEWMHHADMGQGPGANAVTPAAAIPPPVASTPVSPTTAPTAGAGDWHSPIPTEQPSAPQASAPSYSSQAASPMMNPQSPTNAGNGPSPSAPSTSYSGGALPSYGSDLRPAAASAPAISPGPPPPPISSSVPGSPTTSPAAGSGSVPQAAAARPVPVQLSQQPAPMGIAGKAVMAGVGGAVAGAVSADVTARIRLQRIVDAVARQEPRLAWAAGDRPDDATILLTDLAGGWIPPGIEIPSAATLLEPGRRRGDLESLLGEVKLAVNHTPDRYVPEADEPVPASSRPRRAPEIEELGWELSSATHWRDGLPRLAHTLAKAASSGTGVDPSEVELLQQQMHDVGERVLDAYPDEVDSEDVGSWQLLAAIEALVRGDKIGANYHLAWFQACMPSATGQQR